MTNKHHRFAVRAFFATVIENILIVAIYVFVAKLGLQLATINANASPVWPATGVAVSLIFIRGYKAFGAIWLGAFLANIGTGIPLGAVTIIATGNSLEAVCAVYILHRAAPFLKDESLYYSRVFLYSLLAGIPTILSASLGTYALAISEVLSWNNAWVNFITWWIGDALGLLFVFPLVYEVKARLHKGRIAEFFNGGITVAALLKGFIAISLLGASSYFVFGTASGNPYLFVIFFAFLVVMLWLPFWGIYAAGIFVSGYSIWMTNKGIGPFRSGETNESLLHLEFFLASVWLTVIVLSSLKQSDLLRRAAWTFSIGWLLTGATFFSFYEAALRASTMNFEAKTNEATEVVQSTMKSYIRLLEAGASFIESSDVVTAKNWQDFTAGLHFSDRYPGLKGLGVIYPVESDKIQEFEKEYRMHQKGFTVHSVKNATSDHLKDFTQKFVIVYIEPKIDNLPAIGLDIGSESIRFAAAIRARDLNEAALTRDILLQQSPDAGPGYLLLLPFYHRNADLETVEGRRKGFRGFVYSPLEGETFFKFATMAFQKDLELQKFQTTDGEVSSVEKLPEQIRETTTNLAGVPVKLLWQNRNFKAVQGGLAASLAGFCGAFFTLVLAILVAGLEGLGLEARKLAEKMTVEVQERERLWRTLTETSPVGVFLTDANSKYTYVNQRWTTITDLTWEEIKEGKLKDIIHPDDIKRVYVEWEKLLAGHVGDYVCNYRIQIRGKWRYVSSHAVEIRSDKGERIGFLGTLQDMTDLHNNQMALATASRLSSLGQMAGGIAHEINTPLAVISTKVDLMKILLDKPNVEKTYITEQLSKIQETVYRIAKIVRGLKSIAREPSEEKPVLFLLSRAIADTLDLCEKRFENAGIELRYRPYLGESCEVLGYPEQISQVLLNLLNNSFDVVEQRSERWVQIECTQDSDHVRIEVSDSGPSLSEDTRENLFNPFFTTKKAGEGTGLGLSISKAIIEKCEGRLYFDGNRQNTTFVMELPLARPKKMSHYAKI